MSRIAFLFLLLTYPLFALPAVAQEPYRIGVMCAKYKDCYSPVTEAVYTEAYARIGASVSFVYHPWLRNLKEANEGLLDGNAIRTVEAIEDFPNLMIVPTPLVQSTVAVFSKDSNMSVLSPEDLANSIVGVRRGEVFPSKIAQEYAHGIVEADSSEQLYALLESGRVDAILLFRIIGRVDTDDVTSSPLFESGSLYTKPLYHVLNRKYADTLVPRLDAVFKEMLRDGTLERLLGQYSPMILKPEE